MTAAGLVITGRKDNQFISGGENIQPEAIEAALSDERVSVMVVPVADEKFGQRPCAFFDAAIDEDADVVVELLRRRAIDQLPRFMMPVAWLPMPPFAGLKPSRAALTALAATTLAPTSTTSSTSPTSPT